MYVNKIGILIPFIMFFLSSHLEGAIYICVNSQGIEHYSDKKCTADKTVKMEVINDLGKAIIPKYILEYTPIIQTVKRALRLIKQQTPDNKLYQKAYDDSVTAENDHNNYISTKHKTYPNKYNPFKSASLKNIIASISHACRAKAYMTACGIIENNYWLNNEEQKHLKKQLEKGIQIKRTAANKKLFCEKAKRASKGGVISLNLVKYFCETS